MPLYTTPAAARAFTHRLLTSHSLPPTSAATLTSSLLSSDLRGHPSHGLLRLPTYLTRLRTSLLTLTPPTTTRLSPTTSLINAHNTFGAISTTLAVSHACDLASSAGTACVAVKNSNHFGAGAYYIQQAARRGFLAVLFTNSSPAMAAWGGREATLGVSPIAAGCEGWREDEAWVLDMAPSVVARGKVHVAARRGEGIPEGWGLDKMGRATEVAAEVLAGGTMLPVGGYKGSALAVWMDVFSGVVAGSGFGGGVVGPYDMKGEAGVAHMVFVVRRDVFCGDEEWRGRMQRVYENVVGGEKAEGVERIWFPGEKEMVEERRREVEGIPFAEVEVAELDKEADRAGVPRLETAKEKFGDFVE